MPPLYGHLMHPQQTLQTHYHSHYIPEHKEDKLTSKSNKAKVIVRQDTSEISLAKLQGRTLD